MFAALSELVCLVVCLVFESKLLRPSHSPYHITTLLQTSKSKNIASLKTLFNHNDNLNINAQGPNSNNCFLDCDNNRGFCR